MVKNTFSISPFTHFLGQAQNAGTGKCQNRIAINTGKLSGSPEVFSVEHALLAEQT